MGEAPRRRRPSEEKPQPTFAELPASKRITLPTLQFGYGGKPIHYYEGRLYLNGRPITRRGNGR